MDPGAAQAEMVQEDLTWRAICDLAKNQYQFLFEKNKWEPAQHARDSKAPPTGYGNVVWNPAAANANVLVQQGHNRDTSKDKCNKCGEIGHWANKCPNPRLPGQFNGGRNRNNNRHTSGRTNGRHQSQNNRRSGAPNNTTSWKKKATTSSEPTLKHVDGKPWCWCETCRRWSIPHDTAEHTCGTAANSGPQDNTMFIDPSAWCAMATLQPTTLDLLRSNSVIRTLFWSAMTTIITNIAFQPLFAN
jgi:hypothetical protein